MLIKYAGSLMLSGNHRAGVWDLADGELNKTNLFQKRTVEFKLDDLKEFGEGLQLVLRGAVFRQRHRLFSGMKLSMVLECHGQNTAIQWQRRQAFANLGEQFDRRYSWSSIKSVSFAWTWEVAPELETGELSNASLFMSKIGNLLSLLNYMILMDTGVERVMRRDRLRSYPRGGIQSLCNYQSEYPFKAVSTFLSTAHHENSVRIEGGVVRI